MENRNGLAVAGCVIPASGHAERAAALALLGEREGRVDGREKARESEPAVLEKLGAVAGTEDVT